MGQVFQEFTTTSAKWLVLSGERLHGRPVPASNAALSFGKATAFTNQTLLSDILIESDSVRDCGKGLTSDAQQDSLHPEAAGGDPLPRLRLGPGPAVQVWVSVAVAAAVGNFLAGNCDLKARRAFDIEDIRALVMQ